MGSQRQSYAAQNGLNPDVFFTDNDGPISPNMRDEWVDDHKRAVASPDIEYDEETGQYTFTFRVCDELEANYRDDKDYAKSVYSKYPDTTLMFSDAGVFLSGQVKNPGTAVLLSKLVTTPPSDVLME